MPTGYTYEIEKGITFQTFAMNCACAFGALISMRDAPTGAEIPEELKPSTYHSEAIEKLNERLKVLDAMTEIEADTEAEEEYRKEVERNAKYVAGKEELRKKYQAMLADVRAWKPPTPDHVELKNFMESQIVDSIKWDCIGGELSKPKRLAGDKWLQSAKLKALKDLAYNEEENNKEIERVDQRNAWIKALRQSLK